MSLGPIGGGNSSAAAAPSAAENAAAVAAELGPSIADVQTAVDNLAGNMPSAAENAAAVAAAVPDATDIQTAAAAALAASSELSGLASAVAAVPDASEVQAAAAAALTASGLAAAVADISPALTDAEAGVSGGSNIVLAGTPGQSIEVWGWQVSSDSGGTYAFGYSDNDTTNYVGSSIFVGIAANAGSDIMAPVSPRIVCPNGKAFACVMDGGAANVRFHYRIV